MLPVIPWVCWKSPYVLHTYCHRVRRTKMQTYTQHTHHHTHTNCALLQMHAHRHWHTVTDRQKCRHTHHHRQKDTHTVKDTHTDISKHWQTDKQLDTKTHLLSGLWPTPFIQSLKEAVGRVVSSKEQPVSTQNVALSCHRQNAML